MNKLTTAKRIQIVTALVEGMGIRATARLCDVTKGAVSKLLADVGTICAAYHDETVRNLNSKRIQCDEIWAFCYAKRMTVKRRPSILQRNPEAGDAWTWTCIDADSKLIVSWYVGDRSVGAAYEFMNDVASRLRHRVQITTDSLNAYKSVIDDVFAEADYGQLHKIYSTKINEPNRYSPPLVIGVRSSVVRGNPDPKHISTSYVERSNLTMRMHMRRFTRLTNGHSKKVAMHTHAVALHFVYYNFCKIHETLRMTPAMAAGIATSPWEVAHIIELLEQAETAQVA